MPRESKVGSRAQVFHGSKSRTAGGLTRADLMIYKGRIVSRKKHAAGKKAIKRLFALGYKPQKGRFSLMRKSMAKGTAKGMTKSKSMAKGKKSKRSTRKRGGYNGTVTPFADMSGAQGFKDATSGFTGAVPPAPK